MTPLFRRRIVAIAVAGCAAVAALPSSAAGTSSVYSRAEGKTCRKAPDSVPEEHETVIERCPGVAGFTVITAYAGTSVRIAIEFRGTEARDEWRLGTGYGVGSRIEWRGSRDGGIFRPQSGIIRLLSRDDNGKVVSVLAVFRVDGRLACPAAWLDVAATPDANAVARRVADGEVVAFKCGSDKPRIVGQQTDLVKDIAARSQ